MNATIPSGQLWEGVPATYKRDLTKEEKDDIITRANECRELAEKHQKSIGKGPDQIVSEQLYDELLLFDNNVSRAALGLPPKKFPEHISLDY